PEGSANDWRQWRGPLASGAAASTANPPVEWSETNNLRWKVRIPGAGTSTPIIVADKIFLLTAVEEGAAAEKGKAPAGDKGKKGGQGGFGRSPKPTAKVDFNVVCLDRKTGATVWTKTLKSEVPHEGHHRDHGFASFSPVTDGSRLYVLYGSRGLYCLDLAGDVKWTKELGRMETRNGFGEGSSPALHENTLVINWDHEGADFVAAFDKRTGDELWRQPRDEPTSWTTPVICGISGKMQVVIPGTKRCRAYDLATGKELWDAPGLTTNVIPSGIADGEMVYLTSGFRGAEFLAIRLGKTGDLTKTDAIVWKHSKETPYVPSPMLSNGKLYFFKGNEGVLSSLDAATGKPAMAATRVPGLGSVYASPVAVGKELYLRGRNSLYCIAAP
ncbi:MAG TPA: PQQ-binding-like beta-propeller repeat protein, partial [Planctomycetia bacterium]|nr:PQQ-binding-like beta-propeller repeat protein [Planctomycetia bacterium]